MDLGHTTRNGTFGGVCKLKLKLNAAMDNKQKNKSQSSCLCVSESSTNSNVGLVIHQFSKKYTSTMAMA